METRRSNIPGVCFLVGIEMPCHPDNLKTEAIRGIFSNFADKEAATIIVGVSQIHSAWCGVTNDRLLRMEMRNLQKKDAWIIKRSIRKMIKNGLLLAVRERRYNGLWAFLNIFSPRIICPSHLLIGRICVKQACP
ncbi:MAG: hypothetical protein NT162_00520 [Candidatus Woesebacteria bacterium]|nr:hypothetical protein [Candidatus Woesebacteria bacterium]